MRAILAAVAAATVLAGPASAQTTAPAGVYVSDRTHTSIEWQGLHNGIAWYPGRFTNFDIQLTFDPNDVTKSKVTATIDPKSVETDYSRTRPAGNTTDFNAELANDARFFNSAKFPSITFTSTAVTKTGTNTGKMTGNLTFLGVTKPVTLDVTYNGFKTFPAPRKPRVGFELKGSLKRSEWGLTGTGSVGDEIRIEIHAEMTQK